MTTKSIDVMLSKPGIYVLVSGIGVSLCEVYPGGRCEQLHLDTYQPDGELRPDRWNPRQIASILGPFARPAA